KSIGVVGLGLMGTSIISSLVISGCRIIALAPVTNDLEQAPEVLKKQLKHARSLNILSHSVEYYLDRIQITEDYSKLQPCVIVLECVIEDRHIKASVYEKIEAVVPEHTLIGTNTSAIPISSLQPYLKHPGRFMGIHWAEPAYATRFMEITCGADTDPEKAQKVSTWAEGWNKEPILLQKDIRGFITNRLMYAVYREALTLEEEQVATMQDLDKAARYDMGSWISLMGIFQRMDYMNSEEEFVRTRALLPKLSNRTDVPEIMKIQVREKHRGVHSGQGLFTYSKEEAEAWKKAFSLFNRDMYFLSEKYTELKPSTSEIIKS